MKKNYVSEKYGNIIYEESFWTGKKKVTINGTVLKAVSKTAFEYQRENENVRVYVEGNMFKGAQLHVGDEKFLICDKTMWYEYILALLPFILNIVWGNSVELCAIIPVVGGAIGGAISGCLAAVSLSAMKNTKNPLYKILIGLGVLAASFAVCALIGYYIVSSAQ